MFKKLLKSSILFGFMGVCTLSYAQLTRNYSALPVMQSSLTEEVLTSMGKNKSGAISTKAICGDPDEIGYTSAKNLVPGSGLSLPIINTPGGINGVSQEFDAPSEVWIFGTWVYCGATAGSVPVTLNVIFINATTMQSFGNTTLAAGTAGWKRAQLPSGVAIDGPYIVAIVNPTATGVPIFSSVSNTTLKSGRGEDLSGVISNGSIFSALASINASGQPFDADFFIEPIVDYDVFSDFNVTSTPSCIGTDIELTNTSTAIVESRFYNTKAFASYFFGDTDDTYTWTLADGSTVNTKDATTTHSTAGTYTVTLDIAFDTWIGIDACEDTKSETVEFQGDDATFSYGATLVCVGSSDISPSSITTAGGTFSGSGSLIIDATTGEIDITNSPVGSYVVTYEFGGTCPTSSTQNVEIINSPDASFSYSIDEFCINGTNPSPVFTTGIAGEFSSTGGLPINSSTGEIDLATSTPNTYTITNEVSISGCPVVSETFDITINALPTVVANVDNATICLGEEVTFTGSGADSYAWDNGVTDGVAFEPAVGTETYTVTGTDANGCENTATVDVTVNELPTVSGGADQLLCDGEDVTLTGSGADTYAWDNGVTDGVAFTQTTGTTETYTVTGTDANGCENTATVDVTVNELPTVIAGADQTVCEGTQVTLSGSGADTYTWDNGVTDGVAFTATATETYTVTGTDANGCENTASVEVIVNAAPSVSLNPLGIICDNAGNLTLAGGTPTGGVYSGTGVTNGEFDPAAAGVGTHTITYTYEDANSCEGVATASIEVDACAGIEAGNVETLSVFPNPASSELNVMFENTSGTDATVVLTTTDGKIVYQTSAKAMSLFNEKINVTDFANGVYFINIKSETTSLVQRVVLN